MMNLSNQQLKIKPNILRLFPYLVFGSLVFHLNSMLSVNYLVKGYLVLLESQIGLVILYFLARYLKHKYNNK